MTVLPDRAALTYREQQVMRLVAEGLRDKEIAGLLGVSLHTVQSHVRRSLHVLRARNRTHAVALYTRAGAP